MQQFFVILNYAVLAFGIEVQQKQIPVPYPYPVPMSMPMASAPPPQAYYPPPYMPSPFYAYQSGNGQGVDENVVVKKLVARVKTEKAKRQKLEKELKHVLQEDAVLKKEHEQDTKVMSEQKLQLAEDEQHAKDLATAKAVNADTNQKLVELQKVINEAKSRMSHLENVDNELSENASNLMKRQIAVGQHLLAQSKIIADVTHNDEVVSSELQMLRANATQNTHRLQVLMNMQHK